jgi:DinB family protein
MYGSAVPKDAALADLEKARTEWESALAQVPDEALEYLKPGDDYALGGLQVHVNWVLMHYGRILDGLVAGDFAPLAPLDPPGENEEIGKKAKAGLTAEGRRSALAEMDTLHKAIVAAAGQVSEASWARKAQVVYGQGQDPYPTSADDIVGWLSDHYREHVQQCPDLVASWRAGLR